MSPKHLLWSLAAVGVVAAAGAGYFLLSGVDDAREKATLIQLKKTASALEAFYSDYRRYPTTTEGLAQLRDAGYLADSALSDAWGHPLHYELIESRSNTYRLRSLGADGTPAGVGPDADITCCSP